MNLKIGTIKWRAVRFTLIELLVVIAIIAILASLLLPALYRAKEMGKRAVCQGQLKQVGVATSLYLETYNGYYPVSNNELSPVRDSIWANLYVSNQYIPDRNVYFCPSYNGKYCSWFKCSYGINYYIDISNTYSPRKITKIKNLSAIMLNTDSYRTNLEYPGAYIHPHATSHRFHFRHANGANCLFGDGHVEWLHQNDIPWATYNQEGGQVFWWGEIKI